MLGGAGGERPGLQFGRGLCKPMGATAVAKPGMEAGQLLIQLGITPAAPGPFQELKGPAWHLWQRQRAPGAQQLAELVDFRFAWLVMQEMGGEGNRLLSNRGNVIGWKRCGGGLEVGCNGTGITHQQLAPSLERGEWLSSL